MKKMLLFLFRGWNYCHQALSICKRKYIQIGSVLILIAVILTLNSCKKDILRPQKSPLQARGTKAVNNPIANITYGEFLNSIDLDKTGVLKQLLSLEPSNDKQIINSTHDDLTFNLDTKSVKKLVSHDTISYVLSLKPKTPHAVHFENLTIQLLNGNVSAFLTTYLPSKEWNKDWKTNKRMAFKGDVFINKIILNKESKNLVDRSNESISSVKTTNSIVINSVKINLAPGECEVYDIYEWIPVQCSTGDWPGHCPWETQPFSMGEGDYPPGYIVMRTTFVNCAMPGVPGPTGSGGGGGGTTTPNPPIDYDPCNDEPPVMSGIEKNLKILTLPPTDCDPVTPQPQNPVYPYQVQALLSFFDLYGADRAFVVNNQQLAIDLYSELETDGFTYEGKAAALMTIKAGAAGTFSTSDYNYAYNSISSALPNPGVITPQTFALYMSIQCAIVRSEHPEYPSWRVYWEASKEIVHLMLDGAGLVPVVGEVADLANGVIYTIEGDGVNASLSYASAIPIAGWYAAGVKFAKKSITLANGTKTSLKWVIKVGEAVHFGDRGQLRKILNLTIGDLRQAHHILPWAKQTHRAIQKAAKSSKAFHMNSALNGIPLNTSVHVGSHAEYDRQIMLLLNDIDVNLTPEQTADAIEAVIIHVKNTILNNPNTHINNLVF